MHPKEAQNNWRCTCTVKDNSFGPELNSEILNIYTEISILNLAFFASKTLHYILQEQYASKKCLDIWLGIKMEPPVNDMLFNLLSSVVIKCIAK